VFGSIILGLIISTGFSVSGKIFKLHLKIKLDILVKGNSLHWPRGKFLCCTSGSSYIVRYAMLAVSHNQQSGLFRTNRIVQNAKLELGDRRLLMTREIGGQLIRDYLSMIVEI